MRRLPSFMRLVMILVFSWTAGDLSMDVFIMTLFVVFVFVAAVRPCFAVLHMTLVYCLSVFLVRVTRAGARFPRSLKYRVVLAGLRRGSLILIRKA